MLRHLNHRYSTTMAATLAAFVSVAAAESASAQRDATPAEQRAIEVVALKHLAGKEEFPVAGAALDPRLSSPLK